MNANIQALVTEGIRAALSVVGETVQFQTAGVADPADVTVVWNDNEALMPPGVRATAWALESDFSAVPAKNDLFRRGNFTYRVVDGRDVIGFQRDGAGGITIFLRQVNHAPDA